MSGKGSDMRCAIATSVVLGTSPLAAADISLFFDGMNSHEAVYYSFEQGAAIDSESRDTNRLALAGELGFNGGELGLFCIELLEPVSDTAEDYELTGFGTEGTFADRGLILTSLFEQFYDDGFANRSDAAAFAMLTWEIMSETYDADSSLEDVIAGFSLTQGAVQFGEYSDAARDRFELMKSSLFVAANSDPLTIHSNDDYQDFVGYNIPAPGALALIAVAGIAGRPRRRRS